ncbi:MAG: hypothetical protein JNM90_20200 [Burkholderiales bacterium]|nr:hypothetical protein [Burkholderiales bacterium]
MHASARLSALPPGAPRLGPQSWLRTAVRLFARFAQDRDRWVSVVCITGFAVLMWVDRLAA